MPKNKSWWKLYCNDEFITFLGFKPKIEEIVNLDELHTIYQIIAINENHRAEGKLLNHRGVHL